MCAGGLCTLTSRAAHNVGMIERGDRVGFAFEPLAESLGGDLDRDDAVQARITSFVNVAHAAGSQVREDLVRSETGSRRERHGNS